jgi:hypothetical protein
MTGESIPDDLGQLRQQFPGWTFGALWITAGTGPDRRRLTAMKDGIVLSAWSASDLAAVLRRVEG